MIYYEPETIFEYRFIRNYLTTNKVPEQQWLDFIWCIQKRLENKYNIVNCKLSLYYNETRYRFCKKPYHVYNLKFGVHLDD